MAARINTRFILILFIVLTTVAVLVGGLWMLRMKFDVTRHLEAGDQAMAEGDYRDAYGAYGRAVSKEPTNLEYLELMREALLQIRPETPEEARDRYQRYLGVLRHAVRHHPGDPEHHLRLLEELYQSTRRAQVFNMSPYKEWVVEAANEMEQALPPSAPERVYAKFYRGATRLHPLNHDQLVPSDPENGTQFEQGRRDLREFVEAVPDHDAAWASLVTGLRAEAERLRGRAQPTAAAKMFGETKAALEEAQQHVPDGPQTIRAGITVELFELHQTAVDELDAETRQRLEDEAQRLMEQLYAGGIDEDVEPWLVGSTAALLQRLGWLGNAPEPVGFVQKYLDVFPEAHDIRLIKAIMLAKQREEEQLLRAEEECERIQEAELLRVGFLSQLQPDLRTIAASLNVDIAFRRWNRGDQEQRPELVERLAQRCEELKKHVLDRENDPDMQEALGKLAYARGDYAEAARIFDRLAVAAGDDDLDLLLLAADVVAREGNLGRAMQHAENAAGIAPRNPRVMRIQSDLLIRTGRLEEAEEVALELATIEAGLGVEEPRRISDDLLGRIKAERVALTGETTDPLVGAIREAEREFKAGDYGAARAIVLEHVDESPDDLRLLKALVQIEMAANQPGQARQYLRRAMELAPERPDIRRLQVLLETDDPIERIKQLNESNIEDESERVAATLLNLQQLEQAYLRRAAERAAEDRVDEAEENRNVARRAAEEADRLFDRAMELAPNHEYVIEYRFVDAVKQRDWSAAEEVLDAAQKHDVDGAEGLIYRGRLNAARDQMEEAIVAFRSATERLPYSGRAWRLLGQAYEQVGNFSEAVSAYARAYDNNPNDPEIVRSYAAQLSQTGAKQEALEVLRRARRMAPDDRGIRELWLSLEEQIGDQAEYLRQRRRMYENNPTNQLNARRLALFLGTTEPTRRTILDEDGDEVYSTERWLRMSPAEQRRIIFGDPSDPNSGGVQAQWFNEADRIVESLEPPGERGLEWHRLRAELLRARGEADRGEALLKTYAREVTGDDARLRALVAVGEFQRQLGRHADAVATYRAARPLQDPQQRQADRALAVLLYSMGEYVAAREFFELLLANDPGAEMRLMAAECYLRLGEVDAAREQVRLVEQEHGPDVASLLLKAALVETEANQLWRSGSEIEARQRLDERDEILAIAEELAPSSPQPHIARAQSYLHDYRLMGDALKLEDALLELSRADEIRGGEIQTSRVRVAVLQELGDKRGMISELSDILDRSPLTDDARRALIQLLLNERRVSAAIEVAEEGVEANPSSVYWNIAAGDLWERQGNDPARAVPYYRAAVEHENIDDVPAMTRATVKLCDALIRQKRPRYREAFSIIEALPSDYEGQPAMREVKARVLAGVGQKAQAEQEMRVAYRQHRELIAAGKRDPASIAQWYGSIRQMFPEKRPGEIEALAMELSGQSPSPVELRSLAAIWHAGGESGLSRSAELLERAIDACPPENASLLSGLYSDLGVTFLRSGQKAAALEAFERVVELDPENPDALNNVAFLLADTGGDPAAALPHAERAAELRPNDWSIIDTLGWVHFLNGSLASAENRLRDSIALREQPANWLHLAHVLAEQDRLNEARQALERAAELQPDPRTRDEIERLADDIRTRTSRNQ